MWALETCSLWTHILIPPEILSVMASSQLCQCCCLPDWNVSSRVTVRKTSSWWWEQGYVNFVHHQCNPALALSILYGCVMTALVVCALEASPCLAASYKAGRLYIQVLLRTQSKTVFSAVCSHCQFCQPEKERELAAVECHHYFWLQQRRCISAQWVEPSESHLSHCPHLLP